MNVDDLLPLMARLGYTFTDVDWLIQALSHRSSGKQNNERLEFLGDSALSIIITTALFQRFPEASEGQLSRLRAAMVRRETLVKLARKLDLGKYLILGPGELKSGGHQRSSILADALEAVIGSIYLDAGLSRCTEIVLAWWEEVLSGLRVGDDSHKDPKTRLQEYLQKRGQPLPNYQMIEMKVFSHEQVFVVACQSSMLNLTKVGKGSSRRRAEQEAARQMLEVLCNHEL